MRIEDGENSNINIIINNNYNKYNICTIINGAVVDAVGLNLRFPVNLSWPFCKQFININEQTIRKFQEWIFSKIITVPTRFVFYFLQFNVQFRR